MPRLDDPTAFDRSPTNAIILDRRWWKARAKSEERRSDLRDIVDLSFRLFTRKVAGRSIVISNEASLQLHFSQVLAALGRLYEFASDDLFHIELEAVLPLSGATAKSPHRKARVDILLALGCGGSFATCAIELKFFKREHRRSGRSRYDAFADLANLESYSEMHADECYLIMATDDPCYSSNTSHTDAFSNFDLRDGTAYLAGTELKHRASTFSGDSITLANSYEFSWEKLPVWGRGAQWLYCQKVHCTHRQKARTEGV